MTDINGIDKSRATAQQYISKTAGRHANIGKHTIADLIAEMGQPLVELYPAARDKFMFGFGFNKIIGGDAGGCFNSYRPIDAHQSGLNGGGGAGAAFKQGKIDEVLVEAGFTQC